MTYGRLGSLIAGLVALIGEMFATPAAAQSLSTCYYSSGSSLFVQYSECGEAAGAISSIGQNLSAIGDAFANQQLNFGGGLGGFVTPTGRLRHSEHDGLIDKGTGLRTVGFETDEGSVFANGSYDLPGSYFGGKVRVSGLLGYDRLKQDADFDLFKTDIDAFIYGGSYLWSKGSFYSMSLIIGVSGEADAVTGSPGGGKYNYDVSGYFTNSVMGYTFDLRSGWKFDLRGAVGHYDVGTNSFQLANGNGTIKGTSEAWNASLTATFFTIMELEGGVARPYLALSYKNVFDEDIDVKGDFTASFEQADDFGKVEFGLDYVTGPMTYGAAAYTEFSEDESTIGLRLGASYKFQ
jgi:hypothetical protein